MAVLILQRVWHLKTESNLPWRPRSLRLFCLFYLIHLLFSIGYPVGYPWDNLIVFWVNPWVISGFLWPPPFPAV